MADHRDAVKRMLEAAESTLSDTNAIYEDTIDMHDDQAPMTDAEFDRAVARRRYENGHITAEEYRATLATAGRGWRDADYLERDAALLAESMGYAVRDASPLVHAFKSKSSGMGIVGAMRDYAKRQGHDVPHDANALTLVSMTAGTALQHVQEALSNQANGLVMQRMPRLLEPVLRATAPRECRDYKPTPTATVDVTVEAPTTKEFTPYQHVVGRFSGESLQLGMTVVRSRFGRQMVESDDVGAVDGVLSAVTLAAAQNEISEFCSLLNSNPALSDGRDLFNTTDGNDTEVDFVSATPITEMVAAMMNTPINGQPCGAMPTTWLVPVSDYTDALQLAAIVHQGFGNSLEANPLQVFPMADSLLTDWFLFADPNTYPAILRGTLTGSMGQSLKWTPGQAKSGEDAAGLVLLGNHSVGYSAVSRAGVARIRKAAT
jgi:hypothetical protein